VKPPAELNPECIEYRTGYLTVPLDYEASQPTSKVSLELRVSAKLACSTDDFKKSCPVLFYHDGGPGSNDASGTNSNAKDHGGSRSAALAKHAANGYVDQNRASSTARSQRTENLPSDLGSSIPTSSCLASR